MRSIAFSTLNVFLLSITVFVVTPCYGVDQEQSGKEQSFESDPLFDLKKFPKFKDHRDVIVHLDEWTYADIKAECPKLFQAGFAAVQISPVTAFAPSADAWDRRFNVISYDFDNESGNEKQLQEMIAECKKSGIRVFADVVINNMARETDKNKKGEDLSRYVYTNSDGRVIYEESHFHKKCDIAPENYKSSLEKMGDCQKVEESPADKQAQSGQSKPVNRYDYQGAIRSLTKIKDFFRTKRDLEGFKMAINLVDYTNRKIVWECQLNSRHDLKQIDSEERPLKSIQDLLRDLLYVGITGFRILAADHMDPKHLQKVYEWLPRQPVFVYHDVYDPKRSETTEFLIKSENYAEKAKVSDYRYANLLSKTFLAGSLKFNALYKLDDKGLLPSDDSIVFVNNFITIALKNTGIGKVPAIDNDFIRPGTPLDDKALQLATAFMLISNHGTPLITSSSYVATNGKRVLRREHALTTISSMVGFRNVMKKYGEGLIPPPDKFKAWKDNQISYCLGRFGFVIFNYEKKEEAFQRDLETCFEKDGTYCDIFGGGAKVEGNKVTCVGKSMQVTGNGKKGKVAMLNTEGFSAYHIDAVV